MLMVTGETSTTCFDQSGISTVIVGTSIEKLVSQVLLIDCRHLVALRGFFGTFKHRVRLVHRSIIISEFDFRERRDHFVPIFLIFLSSACISAAK